MFCIRSRTKISLTIFFITSVLHVRAQSKWPKYIPVLPDGKITIYEPQCEKLDGNKITGRAAVAVKKTNTDDPVFGAIFFVATIFTDKDSRQVTLESVHVTNAKFPGVADSLKMARLSDIIQQEVLKWHLEISLDAVITSIRQENAGMGTENFKNDPPLILYRNKPSTLVILDGDPKIQKDKNLDADRVVNTPALIFKDENQWHLYSGGTWYASSSILTGWAPNKKLSKKVKSVNDQIKKKEKENNDGKEVTAKPEVTAIIVSKVPAELLQTKGEPNFKSIQGTSLLYISNSINDIFKDITTQKIYVLLSGRWYSAPTIKDKWTYVPATQLPADFAKIPEGSEKDGVLASVPGTPAAEEAKMDAQIPQTAKVDRKTATVKVEYDGEPKFETIEGTSLQLAQNSNTTVMKDSVGRYYALDNGVWFVSNSAKGPWAVAQERPKDVEKIPASSSAYNTKYVYVYESTPEYVYMGYTAGYMGCYIYGPTIVYGTGFYYPGWYGAMYYPRPVTWGFGFSYNPWTGWSMGIGVSFGFMHIGIGFGGYYGGWWGPPIYRPPYMYYGHGGYYGRYPGGIPPGRYPGGLPPGNRPGTQPPGDRPGNRPSQLPSNGNGRNRPGGGGNPQVGHHDSRNNIYNNQKGVSSRDNSRGNSAAMNRPSAQPAGGGNNIFADKNGGVYQRDNKGGWNQRDNGGMQWSPMQNSNKSREMNQDFQNRNRGNMRENGFQQSRGGGGFSGGGMRGGGMRGGGGGRR